MEIVLTMQERRRRLDGERRAQEEIEQLKRELAAMKRPTPVGLIVDRKNVYDNIERDPVGQRLACSLTTQVTRVRSQVRPRARSLGISDNGLTGVIVTS